MWAPRMSFKVVEPRVANEISHTAPRQAKQTACWRGWGPAPLGASALGAQGEGHCWPGWTVELPRPPASSHGHVTAWTRASWSLKTPCISPPGRCVAWMTALGTVHKPRPPGATEPAGPVAPRAGNTREGVSRPCGAEASERTAQLRRHPALSVREGTVSKQGHALGRPGLCEEAVPQPGLAWEVPQQPPAGRR